MSKPNVFQKVAINHFGKPKNKKAKDHLNRISTKIPQWEVFNQQQQYKKYQNEQKKPISKEEAAKG